MLLGLESKCTSVHLAPDAIRRSPTCRSPSGSRACAIRRCAARILAEQAQFDRPDAAFVATAVRQAVPARRPARLRARAASRASRRSRRARAGAARGGRLRPAARARRARAALPAAPQLRGRSTSSRSARCCSTRTRSSGLGDGGAHCGLICDASMPTYLLTHWVRDARAASACRSSRSPPPDARHRALLRPPRSRHARARHARRRQPDRPRRLACVRPEIVYDLPAGGRRLVQRATGYRMTIKTGQVIFEHGEPTGALPGRLVRGPQPR